MPEEKTQIREVKPEHEPEFVEARPEPVGDTCRARIGEYVEDLEPCGNDATHTVVWEDPSGKRSEVARCDDCGAPEELDDRD